MSRILLACPLVCLFMLSSPPALAVYKCERDGKVSYSDFECPNGREIDTGNKPADPEGARQRSSSDKAQLQRLEGERRKHEAQEAKERQRLDRANATRHKRCARLALRKKHVDEDAAKAVGKSREKLALKARRAGEHLELECGGI